MLTSKPRTKSVIITVAGIAGDGMHWATTPLRNTSKRFKQNLFSAKIDALEAIADECDHCSSTPAYNRYLSDYCSDHKYIGFSKFMKIIIDKDQDWTLMTPEMRNRVTFDGKIIPRKNLVDVDS